MLKQILMPKLSFDTWRTIGGKACFKHRTLVSNGQSQKQVHSYVRDCQVQNQNTLKPAYFVADSEKSSMSAVGYNCYKKTSLVKGDSISPQTRPKLTGSTEKQSWKKFHEHLARYCLFPGTKRAHVLQIEAHPCFPIEK